MNTALWKKILAFDFDGPMSEYGFSTRLTYENDWTKHFTAAAMVEYKKFMYLAATSDGMVAPSPIVDIVWHQHLIFTQSYQEFCVLLGKQIQHIPSTHAKEESEKFRQANERTKKLYVSHFGEPPFVIWGYSAMLDSLQLNKTSIDLRTLRTIGIVSFLALVIPFQYALEPLYQRIENPNFILGFLALTLFTFLGLEYFNWRKLREIVGQLDFNSFLFHLHPLELVYLKTQKLSAVINGVVNEQIERKNIRVNDDYTIRKVETVKPRSLEEFQVLEGFGNTETLFYPALLKNLVEKPVFSIMANSMNAFREKFVESKEFGALYRVNLGAFLLLVLLAFGRLLTGYFSHRPIVLILIATVVLLIVIPVYLRHISQLMYTVTIPKLYEEEILPNRGGKTNWEWKYFLLGTDAFATSFTPIAGYVDQHDSSTGGSCGTSCGSSCGSSCSSCGGCGGD